MSRPASRETGVRPVPGGRPIESSRDHPTPTDEPTPKVRSSYADAAHGMHPLLAKQPRYCLVCGELLALPKSKGEPAACGHCLKAYDPADPRTFAPEPPPIPRRWWEDDALPGVAGLALYAGGSAAIGAFLPTWVAGIGGGDGSTGSAFAGVTIAVMLAVLVYLPWLFVCVYLLLLTFQNHLRDEVVWYLTAGGLLGMLCAVGYHPALLIVGGILGVLAGLIRQARMAIDG
ncbi:MAG: hypothetical protein AAGH92_09165 [Planctomycetota bacterium]